MKSFLACLCVCAVLVGCGHSYRTFGQLSADAAAVPVPDAVQFVTERQTMEDGPGFTTSKFEEVTREFQASLSCAALETAWRASLAGSHRGFRVLRGTANGGMLQIELTDRPEHLGITLGRSDVCGTPFIWAYNDPH